RTTFVFDSGPRHGLGHHPDQTRLLDRLDEVAVGADLARLADEYGVIGSSHHDHGDGGIHVADTLQDFHAAESAHPDVEQHDVRTHEADRHERVRAVRGAVHLVAQPDEGHFEALEKLDIVVDDQQPRR